MHLPQNPTRYGKPFLVSLSIVVCLAFSPASGVSQEPRVEAVAGAPFGVGRIILPLDARLDPEQLDTHFMSVTNRDGRVLYPAVRYTQPFGLVLDVLGGKLANQTPNQLHVHFLFTGSEPFDVELSLPERQTIHVSPRGRRFAYQRLLRAWWVRYKTSMQKRNESDYSPVVETFLTSMLSRRMNVPKVSRREVRDDGRSLSMLLGTEQVRLSMLAEAAEGRVLRKQALDQPFPDEINWPDDATAELARGEVEIEPLAHHVPEECFYIRFAQFQNYLWLRRLLEEYGGDLSRMVMLRGTDSQLNQRVENQLGLRESALSSMLGPQVISDVAMIGRDTYLEEGAAIGILFEATNELLSKELSQQRRRRMSELQDDHPTEEILRIEGHDVSFMSTSDNRMRSFYAKSGNYHLVTNCREIATRFLQCENGVGALGRSAEFRYARSLMPLGEDNTLFVYLSRRFFEGLLSPQYQIELPRRLRSITDLQVSELATLACKAEGHGGEAVTMERLVELGILPNSPDERSDGSRNTVSGGLQIDSLRGARGTFLPIPDVPIESVTRDEAESFRRTMQFHQDRWQHMDPVLIGLSRSPLDGQTERVEVQARMLPLNKEKYGVFTEMFGPPTNKRIKAPDHDIVSVQAFVDGGTWAVPEHHLYFGIRDLAPSSKYSNRKFLKSLQVMRTAPAYLAAWPSPGILDALGLTGTPTGDGYRSMLLGLTRLDLDNGFSLLGFDKQILGDVAPALSIETVEDTAQFHVKVGDVKNSKFGQWADDLDFQRAWETSVGNVHLMHLLTQQMRVPLSEADATAERILNAKLICPLDGEYQLHANVDGMKRWSSSAWLDGKVASRQRYVSPLMNWLRGLELRVTIEEDRIVAAGTLDIDREEKEGGIRLPSFNFFGGDKE